VKNLILSNAEKINRLHASVHETFKHRESNEDAQLEWEAACSEFHAAYDSLAFPGGADGALERITGGDFTAIEAALDFLECRPSFFRSGYMYKDFMRKLKHAPLKPDQKARYDVVATKYQEYKSTRKGKA